MPHCAARFGQMGLIHLKIHGARQLRTAAVNMSYEPRSPMCALPLQKEKGKNLSSGIQEKPCESYIGLA